MVKMQHKHPTFRIGVIGDKESGKCSLLNLLLGKETLNEYEDAALGDGKEAIVEYIHSNNSQVCVVDIPSFVYDQHKDFGEYIAVVRLFVTCCDVVLYVCRGSFEQQDHNIFNTIVQLKTRKNVFVVTPDLMTGEEAGQVPNSYLVSTDKASCEGYDRLLHDINQVICQDKRLMLKSYYQSPFRKNFNVQREHVLSEWRVGGVGLLPTLSGGIGSLPVPILPLLFNMFVLLEAVLYMGRQLGVFAKDFIFWPRIKSVQYIERSGGMRFCISCMVTGEVCRILFAPWGLGFSGLLYSFATWGLLARLQENFIECARLKMEEKDEFRIF